MKQILRNVKHEHFSIKLPPIERFILLFILFMIE